MSCPNYCWVCSHQWEHEADPDCYECQGCKEWCEENEMWLGWNNYEPVTHRDMLDHIKEIDNSDLAELLSEIGGQKKTAEEWEDWLEKPMYESE